MTFLILSFASLRPGPFALTSLIFIRPPGQLLAIRSGVQIGIPRFAEGNLAPLPKMSQVAGRHLQNLASLVTPQPFVFAGIRFGNLRIIHDLFLIAIQSRQNMSLPETPLPNPAIVNLIKREPTP